MPNVFSGSRILAGLFVLATLSGCVWIFRDVEVRSLDAAARADTVAVTSPVRVHLKSGHVVLFGGGARFTSGEILAVGDSGQLYGLTFEPLGVVSVLGMDSVVAAETYRTQYNTSRSVATSVLATAGAALLTPALAVAIFGSCPTIYSEGPAGAELEAEAFPNSIVSLFELRDVNPLRVAAMPDGLVRLEIRNEALETHYINHIELLEVAHDEGTVALPAPAGRAYVLHGLAAPTRATSRAGRDVLAALRQRDDASFATEPHTLAAATPDDLNDYIDLTFPAVPGDTAAVVLRLRNSLLNTVYFYDLMLKGQGPRALDWLGRDLESLSYAMEIGDFYARHMGLRVEVWDGGAYRHAGKVGEVGPIAWDEVAVPVAVTPGAPVRVRLRFVADAWRIDHAALASTVATVAPRRVPLLDLETAAPIAPPDAAALLRAADTEYLITMPGTRFFPRFRVGAEPAQGRRTFFLATQGYYTEWMRKDWLETPATDAPFVPSAATLHMAMQRWQQLKPTYEARFEQSKIPVR